MTAAVGVWRLQPAGLDGRRHASCAALSDPSKRLGLRARVRASLARVVAIEDSPHSIAAGVFVGTVVAYQPIVGLQMIIGAIACRLLRINVVASLPLAWITNPFTVVPIFYATYKLGAVFTGGDAGYDEVRAVFDTIGDLGCWQGAVQGTQLLADIFWPMVLGGAIVGVVNGAIFYVLVLRLVRSYQARTRDEP
jgi:uncharacterized protein